MAQESADSCYKFPPSTFAPILINVCSILVFLLKKRKNLCLRFQLPFSLAIIKNGENPRNRAPGEGLWLGSKRQHWKPFSPQVFKKVWFIFSFKSQDCYVGPSKFETFADFRVSFWLLMVDVCRETGERDVQFKVLYCGVCHSDLHMVKNEWGVTLYPIVPG